jgi:spermidine synthase
MGKSEKSGRGRAKIRRPALETSVKKTTEDTRRHPIRRLVLALFFFSGACGLIYQVVWARMLTQVFGTTATAVGVVLAAFMSGLALGSWLLGRTADSSPVPLRFYGLLEIGIGLAALVAHLLLDRITPTYVALYELTGQSQAALSTARFTLAFGLVMAPTFLMGATLPVLARFVVQRLTVLGADLSRLYAINTAGAVAGTLATGFYLIKTLGVHGTVYVAVTTNLVLGAIAWAASSRHSTVRPEPTRKPKAMPAPEAPTERPLPCRPFGLLLFGLGVSGLTSFAYEIYWTRSLVFLLGNSTYAVTTMLTAFIAGIGLGAYLARLVVDRVRDRLALFGWVQVLIAVASAVALPALFLFVDPQAVRQFLGESTQNVGLLMGARFGIALVLMLIPATLIGLTFPLVARIGVARLEHTGRRIGLIYASNTLGNVAGALLPGFVLLGWLGVQRGILLMAALNALLGFTFLGLRLAQVKPLRWAVPTAAMFTLFALSSVPLDFQFPSETEGPTHRVLFYRDGPSATTKVTLDPLAGEKVMAVDGVIIGGNTFTDYKQQLLAHLPKLLLDDVSNELSIGLGSGMLIGESARHPGVERIICVEIEPSVVAGAALFERENRGVLSNPRVRIVVDDIGSYLRTHNTRFQVISADEKTAVDYASNGFSYALDYYRLLREHLAAGGIAIQWVPTNLPPSQYAMVLGTFSAGFPHVLMGQFMPAVKESSYNTILIGSNERLPLDAERVAERLGSMPESFEGLTRFGLTRAEAVLAQFVARGPAIRQAVADAPLNTLDHPRYEFFSPWDYAIPIKQRVAANLDLIAVLRRSAGPALLASIETTKPRQRERLSDAIAAEQYYLAGFRSSLTSGPISAEELFGRYDAALALAPWNASLRARIFLHYSKIAASQHQIWIKADLMGRALQAYDRSATGYIEYSRLQALLGRQQAALEAARRAADLEPDLAAARSTLARLLIDAGQGREAQQHLRALRDINGAIGKDSGTKDRYGTEH